MARVLLVDDQDCVLRAAALLLEMEGHSTVCVLSGVEARRQIEAHDFDVVVTDIRMSPVDGLQLIQSTHASKPDLPVIVITAYSSEVSVAKARELGACDYLKKPFKAEQLLSAIERAVGRKTSK